jgi:LiaI-LiaF-like transmembrane region
MDNSSLPEHRLSLMGPVVLIVLGVMFLLGQFVPGWGIGKTWPALLIVIGVMKLLNSSRPPRAPRGPRV